MNTVYCPRCGLPFVSEAALDQHLATAHYLGRAKPQSASGSKHKDSDTDEFEPVADPSAPQSKRKDSDTDEFEPVSDPLLTDEAYQRLSEEGSGWDDGGRPGVLGWIAIIVGGIWGLRWVIVGLFIAGSVVAGALGAFDKPSAPESKDCPGYQMVRDLKTKGQIDTFRSVQPDQGWQCEYSLDNDDASIRFKRQGGQLQMEVDGIVSTGAYKAAQREARARGYYGANSKSEHYVDAILALRDQNAPQVSSVAQDFERAKTPGQLRAAVVEIRDLSEQTRTTLEGLSPPSQYRSIQDLALQINGEVINACDDLTAAIDANDRAAALDALHRLSRLYNQARERFVTLYRDVSK